MNKSPFVRRGKLRLLLCLLCAVVLSCTACKAAAPTPVTLPEATPDIVAPATTTPEPTPELTPEPAEETLTEAAMLSEMLMQTDRFALRLMQNLRAGYTEENILFSPVALNSALLSLYRSSSGDTQEELRSVLDCTMEPEDAVAGMKQLLQLVKNDAFIPINTLYLTSRVAPNPDFAEQTGDELCTTLTSMNFENGFDEEELRAIGIEPEWLLPPKPIDSLYLSSGFNTYGSFDQPFDPSATKDGTFEGTTGLAPVRMMHGEMLLNYYEDEYVQVVSLPMNGGKTSMILILPQPGKLTDFDEALPQYADIWFSGEAAVPVSVDLSMPAFSLQSLRDYTEVFAQMGLNKALDVRTVDLNGLSSPDTPALPTPIDRMYSIGVLDVSECGINIREGETIASAEAPAQSEESVEMLVDRPFLCAIMQPDTGAILNVGWVNTFGEAPALDADVLQP